ncbi:Inner membrane protein YrbG, predicted calcium/sodium:proton antiporter [hydrothermal vent metagenome]|uniref:Inner membrane protein YrbG, predicted calcium/sodium:proton antiporter n=1 Tax=hydrothermal vent metagenome TaxID=652676 RepID=A0A3B0R739_9ZZZZ
MILSLLGGFVLLFLAGDLLVRGASNLAEKLGVQPLVIGIVIVGFGTSVPELATSVRAALQGAPGIAMGNIVGSNMANMLLILGAGALIYPIATKRSNIYRDGGVGAMGAVFLGLAAWYGELNRPAGIILILILIAYLWFLLHDDHKQRNAHQEKTGEKRANLLSLPVLKDSLLLLGGIAGVLLGGKFLVDGAVELARVYQIEESVVGLTVVALGTSLPELATSIIAALKRQTDLAIGNVLGSNIYNIFGIGGVTATIIPVPISPHMTNIDIPLLIVMSIALIGIIVWQHGVTRKTGVAFLGGYFAYVFYLLA